MKPEVLQFNAPGEAAEPVPGFQEPIFVEIPEDGPADAQHTSPDAPQSTPAAPSMPAWFSRKREQAEQPPKPRRTNPLALIARSARTDFGWYEPDLWQKMRYYFRRTFGRRSDGEVVGQTRYERFARYMRYVLSGSGVSLLVHLLLLMLLAIVVVAKADTKQLNALFVSNAEDPSDPGDFVDTKMDAMKVEVEEELPQTMVVESTLPSVLQANVTEQFRPQISAPGDGKNEGGGGTGFEFSMPTDKKVVTKGSFSAWTVPEDPRPGESYLIIIQVRLPDRVKKYRRSDLSGVVVGTDGYRQTIPEFRRGYLPLKDHQSQLVVRVPGAGNLVKDTIKVRSTTLKEEQTLEIVF